jgi:predicted ester cyclase
VVVRYTGRGTHQGDFMGIAPTGTHVTASAMVIFRLEDSKVVEDWLCVDLLGMLQQLGVIAALGQPKA